VIRWLLERRAARIAVIVGLFVLPLTNVMSAALIVLTSRVAGWRVAGLDVALASGFLAAILGIAGGDATAASPLPAVLVAGVLWSGAVLAGAQLARFGTVDLPVQSLVIAAAAGVLVATLAVPDARGFWEPVLTGLVKAAGLPQAEGLPAGWLGTLAALMHGVLAASLLSTWLLALILGLWLGRHADDPAHWRRQFLMLRLGRVLAVAAAIALVLLAAGLETLGGGLLLVLGTGFAAQGLAVVHWTADARQWPRIWPLVLYGPLLIGAPLAGMGLLALAAAGLADNFVSLRRGRNVV